MKKAISFIIAIILGLSSFSVLALEEGITVIVNGQQIDTPVPARIVNDRTVLPMRVIFESLGAVVNWMPENKMIFATIDDNFIVMQINNYNLVVQSSTSNEKKIVELDVAPFIDSGYTLVPVRAIAETLGAVVDWDPETHIAYILK